MRIVIDIDGTICETKKTGQTYADVRVNPGAIKKIQALKAAGHYIILHSARHMKTMGGDVAKVIEKVGSVTEEWLKRHGIPYDEIHFGKPYNHITIDDRSVVFEGWEYLDPEDFLSERCTVVLDLVHGGEDEAWAFSDVNGKQVYAWIAESLSRMSIRPTRCIALVPPELVQHAELQTVLKGLFEVVIILPFRTDSAELDMVFALEPYVNNLQQLVIHVGSGVQSLDLSVALEESNIMGLVGVSDIAESRYGRVVNDVWGYVSGFTDAAFDGYALTGVYYFKRGIDFISTAKRASAQAKSRADLKLLACYNELVKRGQTLRAVKDRAYIDLSSPKALEELGRREG